MGKFGTPDSKARYDRPLCEWLASNRQLPSHSCASLDNQVDPQRDAHSDFVRGSHPDGPAAEQDRVAGNGNGYVAARMSIDELVLRYWKHAKSYYVKAGQVTSEPETIRQALNFVMRQYSGSSAREFGPLRLKAVRQAMMEHEVVRKIKGQKMTVPP